MTSQFDRWEKDPFFPAAEEVQESADRYTYIYIHSCICPNLTICFDYLLIYDFDALIVVVVVVVIGGL